MNKTLSCQTRSLSKCFLYKVSKNVPFSAGSSLGFPNPCFGYITNSGGVFVAENNTIELFPGDLVFIPKGQIYTSHWFPNPTLEFYSLNFEFTSETSTRYMYEFSKIHIPQLLHIFQRMYENISNNTANYQFLSDFYAILAEAEKHFKKAKLPTYGDIAAALDYIETNSNDEIKVPFLAKLCCMSESKFYARFKESVGYTPTDYKNLIKVRKAEVLISNGQLTLEDICSQCGFSSPSYLRRIYRKFTGKTPTETRKNANII